MDILFQQDLHKALENNKYEDMMEAKLTNINHLVCERFTLYLKKDQKYVVIRETIASDFWQKLKNKYIMNNIENCLFKKEALLVPT